jgi:hypothetical protein
MAGLDPAIHELKGAAERPPFFVNYGRKCLVNAVKLLFITRSLKVLWLSQ